MTSRFRLIMIFAVLMLVIGSAVYAQEATTGDETAAVEKSALRVGLIALASALAIGVTAIGTGIAQSRIGAAGAGTIAERPETSGTIIILLAIPETMVILGFIVSVIILFTL